LQKKAIFATYQKQDGERIMKQQDEAMTRALKAAEKIANQYLELDTENIDDKRIKELLNEALPVVGNASKCWEAITPTQ
jgi:hypothetical protein